jgi:hypothetical protein
MLEYFALIKNIDSILAGIKDEKSKNQFLIQMMKYECRFNIDLISSIKVSKANDKNYEIRSIINLLSTFAIQKCIEESFKSKNSSFLGSLALNISSDVQSLLSQSSFNKLESNDPILFNVYKRILVLKALASIEPPYQNLKDLRFITRLKNLKSTLIEIAKADFK